MKKSRESIEIEVKVQVQKTDKLQSFLNKNAKYLGEKRQIDKYYTPAHKNFIGAKPVNEWLRLRDSSGNYSINYKNWHRQEDGRTHFCDEYESAVESLEQLENIFRVLDVKPLVTVDKTRRAWLYQDFEIAIDSVKGLGDFIEIEYKGTNTSKKPERITADMIKFLQSHGCGKIVRDYVGYPFKLLFPGDKIQEEY